MTRYNFFPFKTLSLYSVLLISICLSIAIGCKSRIEREIYNIQDRQPALRYLAVGALGKIGGKNAVKHLIAALKDEDPDVVLLDELPVFRRDALPGVLRGI